MASSEPPYTSPPKRWLAQTIPLVAVVAQPRPLTPISIRCYLQAIAFDQAPLPQAILTLGGDPTREAFAAQFAQMHPSLEIWVSSPPEKVFDFQAAGISNTRVHIEPAESWLRILRDSGRALLWIVIGSTGASLKTEL